MGHLHGEGRHPPAGRSSGGDQPHVVLRQTRDLPHRAAAIAQPLKQQVEVSRFGALCGKSSTDQGSEFTVETREFLVETREAVVRSTFLFTDGHANMGITKTEDLCQAASGLLGELKEYKSSISTFGFGADHNADMLRCLADTTTDGTYSHVESEDQIAEVFGEALGGQNLKRLYWTYHFRRI